MIGYVGYREWVEEVVVDLGVFYYLVLGEFEDLSLVWFIGLVEFLGVFELGDGFLVEVGVFGGVVVVWGIDVVVVLCGVGWEVLEDFVVVVEVVDYYFRWWVDLVEVVVVVGWEWWVFWG